MLEVCSHGLYLGGCIRPSEARYAEIGNSFHIGEGIFVRAEGGLKIGDNTHISRHLVLCSSNHQYKGKRLPSGLNVDMLMGLLACIQRDAPDALTPDRCRSFASALHQSSIYAYRKGAETIPLDGFNRLAECLLNLSIEKELSTNL
ncbi:hypothetical protein [cf. Phormidesmis sp. LEGE 11477]|uniref:hypothetical protein n=1 Tax=cf. Phormidesmis sp. LEGE 11477 TaxID=1828680 RepID=UPI0018803B71|nr:hypothetical protein [cf. Phormidesmis sp. LEGE 11477]MBE9061358.1 hypothetical protein [cf. Phormidesmis sp. LEGE 11477]